MRSNSFPDYDANSLGGFSIVRLDESAEFALATNSAFGFRNEGFVQYRVVPTDPAMWALLMIVFMPHAKNIVEVSSTEANEMVQYLCWIQG